MEKIKQKYRELTGREPGKIVVLGEDTASKFAEVVSNTYGGHFISDDRLREMRFFTLRKTKSGYEFHDIDVHKTNGGHYAGIEIDASILPDEIKLHAKKLKAGQTVTYYHEAKDAAQIAKLTEHDIHPKHQRKPPQTAETSSDFYCKRELFVLNRLGFHARPSVEIIKTANKYGDCDIFLNYKGNRVSAKSIIGIMTLNVKLGDIITAEAAGIGARACIDSLEELFKNKFGEN